MPRSVKLPCRLGHCFPLHSPFCLTLVFKRLPAFLIVPVSLRLLDLRKLLPQLLPCFFKLLECGVEPVFHICDLFPDRSFVEFSKLLIDPLGLSHRVHRLICRRRSRRQSRSTEGRQHHHAPPPHSRNK